MSGDLVLEPESGLFSEALLRAVLPSRVATARRTLRQLGVVLVAVGSGPAPEELARLVQRAVRDSDMAVRLDDGRILLVLEFTPSEGCVIVAERLRERVLEVTPSAEVTIGVACYPAHAISADELLDTAELAGSSGGPGEVTVAAVPE